MMNIGMISRRVAAGLSATGFEARHAYSQFWSRAPVIVWRESGNRSAARADGSELLSELEYTLDIYALAQEEGTRMAEASDAAMTELGLQRTYATELFESDVKLHHRVMRYRCIVDEQGNIYQ